MTTARATRAEVRARLEAAPQPRLGYTADETIIETLAVGYTRITGEGCESPGRRRFLAGCYRVHGEDTLALLEELYRATGTTTNLLLVLREHEAALDLRGTAISPAHARRGRPGPRRGDPDEDAYPAPRQRLHVISRAPERPSPGR